jgi:8-oxo-dGTP pyrophosphatase MutT (NUDIX family)
MKQSYKIYINDIVVILAQHKQVFNIPKNLKSCTIYNCNKEADLLKLITAVEIQSIKDNLIILSNDLMWLKQTFFSAFKIITAGGGLVQNENKDFLLMFRNGKWDLPKGKIEPNEKTKTGACREIEEETGVKVLDVKKKLGKTYHTFKLKDKWMLKETTWYLMVGDGKSKLKPQLEENIEQVGWYSKTEAKKMITKNSYPSIRDVFSLNF